MSLTNLSLTSSRSKLTLGHSHNLSINSASSITEPTTPPSVGSTPKLYFWDSNKSNGNLILPSFNLESIPTYNNLHSRKISVESSGSDKENRPVFGYQQSRREGGKIDREYLISILKTPLSELSGEILRLAKDQHGCRFLQKRLDESYVPDVPSRKANYEIIFEQVKMSLYELIIDPFGNYLVQKLIDYVQTPDLDFCLEALNSNMFLISINQHGTRAFQKIIDKINTETQFNMLVRGLKPYIIELIKDLNGNHVIQKVLNKYRPEKCQFIYDSILADLLTVATHKHGCCVLQKCLNHVTAAQHMAFAEIILNYDNFSDLVNDQFGNYVLQYLISIDSIDVNFKLYQNIYEYGLTDLCVLKFSSNVIEKLMMNCFKNETKLIAFSNLKFTIIGHLLNGGLNKLINNAYGNYVVQTLTDILINTKAQYFIELPRGGQNLLPSLRKLLDNDFQSSPDTLQVQIVKKWFQDCKIDSTFGKKIQSKINTILSGSVRTYHRKSHDASSSSLRINYDSEAGRMLQTPQASISHPINYAFQTQGPHGSHQASLCPQNDVYQLQQVTTNMYQEQNFNDSQQFYFRSNDTGRSQSRNVSYGSYVSNPTQQHYPITRSTNSHTSRAPVHLAYQQELANLRNASYPALNQMKTDPFNSTDLANKSRVSSYKDHPSLVSSPLLDNRFASQYEEANARVAHASFLQNRQWPRNFQRF